MRDLKFNPKAQDAASAHLNYSAYVDGLRAIAVLSVLFFHADLGFGGGYVGVDVFFVISGYLITGLILKDLESGQFSIVKFWERRVRRIMPALAVVVLATLVAGWFLLLPQAFKELGESAVAQSLLVSNIYFWIKSWIGVGYFTPAAEVKPLLHTWSLAVEEQFYLFFPFLLLLLKRFDHRRLFSTLLILCGISFGLSVWCGYFHPAINFYFLPPRAWELLLGALLATLPAQAFRFSAPVREASSWGGLLGILCAIFLYTRETPFPGVSALLPCLGTALIIWANKERLTSVGELLALRPVVFIGLISYSLYLWHWPMLVFGKYWAVDPLTQGQRLLILFGSLVLAVLSWKFVEAPFRQRVILKTRPQVFTFAGATTVGLLIASFSIYLLHGVSARLPNEALNYANTETKTAWDWDLQLKEVVAGNLIQLGTADKSQQIDLLVWGDSHAMSVMPVFDLMCKEQLVGGVAATRSATPPLLSYISKQAGLKSDSIAYNRSLVNFIRSRRVRNVVLVASWGVYLADDDEAARLRRCLSETIGAIQDQGVNIWILKQVPKQKWNVPNTLAVTVWRGGDLEKLGLPLADQRTESRRQDVIFEGLGQKYTNVTILDPTVFFIGSNNLCQVVKDGQPLYFDGNHLTAAGAMLLRPLFEPIFVGIKKNGIR